MGRFIIAVTGNHFVHRQVRPFPAHFSRLSREVIIAGRDGN